MSRRKKMLMFVLTVVTVCMVHIPYCMAAKDGVEKYIPDTEKVAAGITLWQTIVAGGEVMFLLGFLSIAAVALIIFYFLTFKRSKLLPESFLERILTLLEQKKFEEAKKACAEKKNFIAAIVWAGLSRSGHDKEMIKEAMQDEGRRRIDSLRQRLSYLGDIVTVAPLAGLLGTVLGMIEAFNVIAFQAGGIKPVLLASGISKAMITTAAGLIIAIPSLCFYSLFRSWVQDIIAMLENMSTELYHLITRD